MVKMKVSSSEQKTINEFFRKHVDRGYKNPMNSVRLSVDHTPEHRIRIFEVCNALLEEKIPFWTEVRLNCGCIPDIVTPTHIVKFIEVFGTEKIEDFYSNKYDKYKSAGFVTSDFIFIEARSEFSKNLLW